MDTNGPLRWYQRCTKTLFDYSLTLIALFIAAPLMLVIALAIYAEDRGPIFSREARIGLGNRPFRIWKFRTTRVQSTGDLCAILTARDEPGVTRIGRFLRLTSLDELPQLFNVLARQMSLVGPYPRVPVASSEEQLLRDDDLRYWLRHSVRPGITGLEQVRGLSGGIEKQGDLEERLLLADLEYATSWSLLTDVKIVIGTIRAVLHRNAF